MNDGSLKTCSKCHKEKPLSEFSKDKSKADGHYPSCKDCMNLYSKDYYLRNKNKILNKHKKLRLENPEEHKRKRSKYKQWRDNYNKKYYSEHKNEAKSHNIQYRDKNREKINSQKRLHYLLNKDRLLNEKKQYYFDNKETILQQHNKYIRKKRKENPTFRLIANLRARTQIALKTEIKSKRTLELLGCSSKEFRKYIESKFTEGMTWDNYGLGANGKGMQEWHLDHIRPCASFDLSKPEEQQICFHWCNYQPLWATYNLKKHKKYAL